MSDIKVSWLELDTSVTPCDVNVSWIELNTDAPQPIMASLGGVPERIKRKPKTEEYKETPEEVTESISAPDVSRLRNEFLSESLAQDLITRARKRKSRAEEEALLLIL